MGKLWAEFRISLSILFSHSIIFSILSAESWQLNLVGMVDADLRGCQLNLAGMVDPGNPSGMRISAESSMYFDGVASSACTRGR